MRLPPPPTRRGPTAASSRSPSITARRPALPFQVETARNPIDNVTAPDNDIEGQTTESLDEIQKAFRAAEAKQIAEVKDYAPIEFYRVLVFATPAQARAFMRAIGQDEATQYLDGRKVCDKLGIAIPADVWKPKKGLMSPNRRLAPLAMPLPPKRKA